MTIQMSPDVLVQSFLRRAAEDGTAALVMYAFADSQGQPVMRMASNRDDATTRNFLAWATGADARVVLTVARALAAADGLDWTALDEDKRAEYERVAGVAIEAASAAQPRTLNPST